MTTGTRSHSGYPCPSFFRAACRRAAEGEKGGYLVAGYTLAMHLHGLAPDRLDAGEWAARLSRLADLICPDERPIGYRRPADDGPIVRWLLANVPACMRLVPSSRRARFVEGVYRWVIDEENDIANQ